MSTLSLAASKLGTAKNSVSSTWTSGSAYQGQYAGTSNSRVGLIIFSGIRSSVSWKEQKVNSISLTCTFAKAGTGKEKTIVMYQSTVSSLTGVGSDALGTSIGSFTTNGTA